MEWDMKTEQQKVKRQTAGERREEVIRAAIIEFAALGLHGGSTERIAVAAGISQPYVLRLFGTKKALFIAALNQVCEDIVTTWQAELERLRRDHGPLVTPQQRLQALGSTYFRFVQEVDELRLVLQGSAAAEDVEVRTHLKAGMNRMFDWLRQATGADYHDVQTFWAQGMMLTIAASVRAIDDIETSEWARATLMMPERPLPKV
jgi:AcrR family transcriptional regulator